MCGEMYYEHVGPAHRTGKDACAGVESLASIRQDPIILEYLLPASVVVAVPAAVEEHRHPVCQTTPGKVRSEEEVLRGERREERDSPQHFILSHEVIPETGQSRGVGVSVVIDDCGDPPVIEYSLLHLRLYLHCQTLQVALPPLHLLLQGGLQLLDPLLLHLVLLPQLVNLPALLVEDLPQPLHLLPLKDLHCLFQ